MRIFDYLKRFSVLFLGLFLCGVGAVFTIRATLGVSPWDVFHIGVTNYLPITMGRVQQATGLAIILSTVAFTKRFPKIGTFLNMFFIGFFVDLIIKSGIIPSVDILIYRIVFLIVGILLLGTGSGMYLSARLGAGPRDGLMLYLSERFKLRIRTIRTIMEVVVVITGFLLGGPVGIGTIVVSLTIGPVMEVAINVFRRVMGDSKKVTLVALDH
jgi:hypothetical protein